MRKIITAAVSAALALGLSGCGGQDTSEPGSATSETATTTSQEPTTSTTTTFETSTPAEPTRSSEEATEEATLEATLEPIIEQPTPAPSPQPEPTTVAPQAPVFMDPEDFDPYGPPRFVQCWEPNAAVMSDGSIVTDSVNCPNTNPAWGPVAGQADAYQDPPRADGCVGPAAVCGYYDEDGNPIWFDKMTGETSPRYYDEYGNPTMGAP